MIYYSGQDKKKKKGEFVIRGMLCGKMVSASKQYQYAFQIETKKRIWYLYVFSYSKSNSSPQIFNFLSIT